MAAEGTELATLFAIFTYLPTQSKLLDCATKILNCCEALTDSGPSLWTQLAALWSTELWTFPTLLELARAFAALVKKDVDALNWLESEIRLGNEPLSVAGVPIVCYIYEGPLTERAELLGRYLAGTSHSSAPVLRSFCETQLRGLLPPVVGYDTFVSRPSSLASAAVGSMEWVARFDLERRQSLRNMNTAEIKTLSSGNNVAAAMIDYFCFIGDIDRAAEWMKDVEVDSMGSGRCYFRVVTVLTLLLRNDVEQRHEMLLWRSLLAYMLHDARDVDVATGRHQRKGYTTVDTVALLNFRGVDCTPSAVRRAVADCGLDRVLTTRLQLLISEPSQWQSELLPLYLIAIRELLNLDALSGDVADNLKRVLPIMAETISTPWFTISLLLLPAPLEMSISPPQAFESLTCGSQNTPVCIRLSKDCTHGKDWRTLLVELCWTRWVPLDRRTFIKLAASATIQVPSVVLEFVLSSFKAELSTDEPITTLLDDLRAILLKVPARSSVIGDRLVDVLVVFATRITKADLSAAEKLFRVINDWRINSSISVRTCTSKVTSRLIEQDALKQRIYHASLRLLCAANGEESILQTESKTFSFAKVPTQRVLVRPAAAEATQNVEADGFFAQLEKASEFVVENFHVQPRSGTIVSTDQLPVVVSMSRQERIQISLH